MAVGSCGAARFFAGRGQPGTTRKTVTSSALSPGSSKPKKGKRQGGIVLSFVFHFGLGSVRVRPC
jgi:hypothetical protein